ncbi:Ser/Thr protein phosphatase [Tritrichomonas foetus]|uniref:Serine/threonine-protein phosphatase n=1 Tax=Tritrichomonas foetus TaxID=1144522 RepID=A0A1J4J3D3_9EUKA|nr:Ser/Thr protein phosphatase [Tritrichomonas foetus]|eukprot:OHS93934.1 Ser/Thr protein phosphatase [Tritrichomonas foetus]
MQNKIASQVLKAYKPLLDINVNEFDKIGREIPIPTFEPDIIVKISEPATDAFQKQPMILELQAPIYVVGDIHGNIFDLIRILAHTTSPPRSRLLFLGDYVDRGEFSLEVVMLLFSLMLNYPDSVFLLRGNHEFEAMNFQYGFLNEVNSQFGSKFVYDKINDTFQYMPLVAIINDVYFCVHGGISPNLPNLKEINKIKRPLVTYEAEYVSDLVWSDPTYDVKQFNESNRGLGVQFGIAALKNFLEKFEKKKLLRAHQCVMPGVSVFGDGLLYTVFSSSNYADAKENKCGLLFIELNLNIQMFSLPMMEMIPRDKTNIQKHTSAETTAVMTAKDSLALNLNMHEKKAKPNRFGSSSGFFKIQSNKMKTKCLIMKKFHTSLSMSDFKVQMPTAVVPKSNTMNLASVELPKLD